jgi:hypothetical protein
MMPTDIFTLQLTDILTLLRQPGVPTVRSIGELPFIAGGDCGKQCEKKPFIEYDEV